MDSQRIYETWLQEPTLSDEARAELLAIAGKPAEIEERFYRGLSFGTAGLRGIMGQGTNRMNVPVVRRATQGLADYLKRGDGASERGVCIAYDTRHLSEAFARETAAVLAAGGIRAYLFDTPHAVPQLSYALRRLNCAAGVVITASHNPKEYNGYKVYAAHGGQVSPRQADEILDCIERVDMFRPKPAYDSPLIQSIGEAEDEAYYAAAESVMLRRDAVLHTGSRLKIVYTPLHGTGRVPVVALLQRAGITNVSLVPGQAEPDGDFPSVAAPNPEDPAAFRSAIALADEVGATVCLATDPDADRLGVAVKSRAGEWALLTGNQIACVLLEHILSSLSEQERLPANGAVVKSIVSTPLADTICAAYDVALENVMTGFRFISEKIDAWQKSGEKTFLFGFEESFGFLAGGFSRDKDAILSALLVAEACVVCQNRGLSLYDMLQEIYQKYGYYKEATLSYTLDGKAGTERIRACMEQLRQQPFAEIAGDPVLRFEDYRSRSARNARGETEPLSLPQADMLRYILQSGATIAARPSGTEPKLKLYISASASDEADADAQLARLREALAASVAAFLA